MNIVRAATELKRDSRKVCLAIGFFDGVHLGHQQIIRQTIADARRHEALSLVVTFDRHPSTIVAPNRVPPLIYSLSQKIRAIEALGSDALLLIHFDRPFSEQPGASFVRGLARDLGQVQSLCVGSNFTFGHKRDGNVALLKNLGAELKFFVHGMAAVSLDGKIVSSTRIRETIRGGDLDAASQMLGRPYSLSGTVVRGDELGRELGFPTANLDVSGLLLPPNGVYAVHASIFASPSPGREEGQSEGESRAPRARITHRAVVNIGSRPTLKSPVSQIRVEAHLLDFNAQLYGQELEITFVEKLREEKQFHSLAALKHQIMQDISEAKSRF